MSRFLVPAGSHARGLVDRAGISAPASGRRLRGAPGSMLLVAGYHACLPFGGGRSVVAFGRLSRARVGVQGCR